jgi:hypothetical protein
MIVDDIIQLDALTSMQEWGDADQEVPAYRRLPGRRAPDQGAAIATYFSSAAESRNDRSLHVLVGRVAICVRRMPV